MTLFRQVALLVTLVFLLNVVAISGASLDQYSTIVKGQLQSTAQDMTTTLAIALSNSTFGNDVPAYETLFNAVFDSGYYSSIELVDPAGNVIHKKDRKLEIEGVPGWFTSLVNINSASAAAPVMQGWIPLGTLKITLHPGYVYLGLYNNFVSSIVWFSVIFVVSLLVLWLLLHYVLKPLYAVRQQADAISSNQFVTQSSIPRTVELRTVVNAMNRMVEKVHAIFTEQEQTLAKYQKAVYEDQLTGLANRCCFLNCLESVHSADDAYYSHLAVIKILNLDLVREQRGYQSSDKALNLLAAILNNISDAREDLYCARLSDDEFALLAQTDNEPIKSHIDKAFEDFRSSSEMHELLSDISLIAGVAPIQLEQGMGKTLADSDFALAQAETSGPYSIRQANTEKLKLPQGKIQWRNWLEQCLDQNMFFLVKQKAVSIKGDTLHEEVYVRLRNGYDQIIPAGIFMPMASALNMGEDVDRVVFRLVKDLCKGERNIPIALNLTSSVFSHADALVEFNQLLTHFQQSKLRLCVEASHAILEQYPTMCAEVADSVRRTGHMFGIDNINLGLSLNELKNIRPGYIKINARTIYDISKKDNLAGYQALSTITTTMGSRLIAIAVDSQEVHDHLRQLNIECMQGNLFGEPEEFV
jgi:EAL domain-containing protein (putative c-di-GMP-specific phosphodiesterase class I)/GGDEF domain-containing protein